MNEASATFSLHYPEEGQSPLLVIFSAADKTSAPLSHPIVDPGKRWDSLLHGAIGRMHASMKEALDDPLRPYPVAAGADLLSFIGWEKGFDLVTQAMQSSTPPLPLTLILTYQSCELLPELLPAGEKWLDTLGPVYRIIDHLACPPVDRPPERTLAILYATGDGNELFESQAKSLQRQLQPYLIVDTFSGEEFQRLKGDDAGRFDLLIEIFRKHRAVFFLGHLSDPSDKGRGWLLHPGHVLSISDLRRFLRADQTSSTAPNQRRIVPELVYACCCYSAGRDPSGREEQGLSYPHAFLDAGVRFFVGASIDIRLGMHQAQTPALDSQDPPLAIHCVVKLAAEFFTRWALNPSETVSRTHVFCTFYCTTRTSLKQWRFARYTTSFIWCAPCNRRNWRRGWEVRARPCGWRLQRISRLRSAGMSGDVFWKTSPRMRISPFRRHFRRMRRTM